MIQKDLAPKLGVQQSALAKKLRGQRGWSVEEVIRAARELHVTTSYLVGETDDDTLGQVTPGAGAGPNLPPRLYKGDDSNVIPLFGAQTFERIAA